MALTLDLIRNAASLLRARWVTMAAWILGGLLVQWVLLQLAFTAATAGVSEDLESSLPRSSAAACLFALSVIAYLVGFVGALYTVRTKLPFVGAARRHMERRNASLTDREEAFLHALAASLLPLLVVYGAWGLFNNDWRALQVRIVLAGGAPPQLEEPLQFLGLAAVAFLVRLLTERRFRADHGMVAGIVSGIFEGLWMVLALIGIAHYVDIVMEWIRDRTIVDTVSDLFAGVATAVDTALTPTLSQIVAALFASLLVALVWLVIGITVLVGETDLGDGDSSISFARRFALLASGELREKWVPMFAAARLIVQVGIVVFLAYAVTHELARLVADGVDRLVRLAVGPRALPVWLAIEDLQDVGTSFIVEPLRVVAIAVGVEELVRRSGPTAPQRAETPALHADPSAVTA